MWCVVGCIDVVCCGVVLCCVVLCCVLLILLMCTNLGHYSSKNAFFYTTLFCVHHTLSLSLLNLISPHIIHSRDEKYKLLCSSYSVPPHIAVVMQFAKGTLTQTGPGRQYACTYTFADSVHPSVLRAFKNTE